MPLLVNSIHTFFIASIRDSYRRIFHADQPAGILKEFKKLEEILKSGQMTVNLGQSTKRDGKEKEHPVHSASIVEEPAAIYYTAAPNSMLQNFISRLSIY